MTIDVEFLLARHPLLFLWWKCRIEGFHGGNVLAAIRGSGRNIHPFFAVQHVWNKLTNKECRWEVAFTNKAHVLLFAAHKSTADVVPRIAEVDIHVVAHLACNLKGMLDQKFSKLLPLVFRRNTKRSEREDLLALTLLILKPSLCVHDVADNLAVFLKHECQLGNEIGVASHRVYEVVLVRTGFVDVPKCLRPKSPDFT